MRHTSSRTLLAVAALIVSIAAAAVPPLAAQVDLAKVLVGQWDGQVNIPRSRNPAGRTLVIKSAVQQDGVWAVDARYGVTGTGLAPVMVAVDTAGGATTLSFVTGANATIRLTVTGEKNLSGTFELSGTHRAYSITFEKAQ